MPLDDVSWDDHRFILLEDKPVERIEYRTIDVTKLTKPPYMETHKGETGVVFFASLDVAKSYMAYRKLTGYNIIGLPVSKTVGGMVCYSVLHWGCSVAFCYVRDANGGLRRDVTEITECPDGSGSGLRPGQHRM